MYVVTFTCTDRNGDDGIIRPRGGIGDALYLTESPALHAAANDAEAHAAMYADTDETHWHEAFTKAAAELRSRANAALFAPTIDNHYTLPIRGDHHPTDHHEWDLGDYSIWRIRHHYCAECEWEIPAELWDALVRNGDAPADTLCPDCHYETHHTYSRHSRTAQH